MNRHAHSFVPHNIDTQGYSQDKKYIATQGELQTTSSGGFRNLERGVQFEKFWIATPTSGHVGSPI